MFEFPKSLVIFGAGKFSETLTKFINELNVEIIGYVATCEQDASFNGQKVYNWKTLPAHFKNFPIIIAIFNQNNAIYDLIELCATNGFKSIISPFDILDSYPKLNFERFYFHSFKFYQKYDEDLKTALKLFKDPASKEIFKNTLSFRAGKNILFSRFKSKGRPYTNELTLNHFHSKNFHFIDGGAFLGESTLELMVHANIASSYLFEPDTKNFGRLHSVDFGNCNACLLPLGLSDRPEIVNFVNSASSSSRISPQGDGKILTIRLDDYFYDQKINFIKLDIEGLELQALKGAENLIQRNRPLIAVAIYHRPEDIFQIPIYLSRVCQDYSMYLRQHGFNTFDSILYCIPN